MAQFASDQARYLQEALAIARSRIAAPTPGEFLHVYALACQLDEVLTALIRLEEVASTTPAGLDPQSGVHETLFLSWQRSLQQAVGDAREVIHAAGALTEAEEIQANLMRERDAELGPDYPATEEERRIERQIAAHESAERDEPRVELEDDASREEREAELGPDLPSRDEQEADAIASEFVDKEPTGVSLQEEIDRS